MPISEAKTITERVDPKGQRFPLLLDVEAFQGGFVGLNDWAHPTAASRGRLDVWDASEGMIPVGPNEGFPEQAIDDSSVTGDTDGDVDLITKLYPRILPDVTVAGLTDEEDTLRYVYLTDDDVDADLTLTSNGNPVGRVLRYITGTRGVVLLWGFLLGQVAQMSAYGFRTIPLGTISVDGLSGATGLQFEAQQRFALVGGETSIVEANLGGSGDVTVALFRDNNQAHADGERMTFSGGNTVGTRRETDYAEVLTGTNRNIFAAGDVINVRLPTNGGVTGRIQVNARVLYLGG